LGRNTLTDALTSRVVCPARVGLAGLKRVVDELGRTYADKRDPDLLSDPVARGRENCSDEYGQQSRSVVRRGRCHLRIVHSHL